MKKIISLLLTALMLMSVFTTAVSANELDVGLPFTDLVEGAWYIEGIEYCYSNGIVAGMTETTFAPNGTLTRAQFVQILAMYDGADLSVYEGLSCGFEDVKPSHWYNGAVCWAYSNGYVSGMSETRFAPNEPITREQFARILYVYAESYNADVSYRAELSAFKDEAKVSSWAYEQVQWAVAIGIISGVSETSLAPRDNATRAQACRMIMTFNDYFYVGHLKNDLFFVLVDYVTANGTVSEEDPAVTEIVEESEDVTFVLCYDSDFGSVDFECYSGKIETTDGFGGIYTTYEKYGAVRLDDIYESYAFSIVLSDATLENYYMHIGMMYSDGEVPLIEDGTGLDEEYIANNCEIIKTALNGFIMKHITAAGISLEDMFLQVDYNRDGSYKILADYITANGTEGEYGEYTVTVLADGTDFFADYNPISGDITFRFYDGNGGAIMTMTELSDEYICTYLYEDYDNEEYVSAARYMKADGEEIELFDHTFDEETAYAMEEAAYAVFSEGLTQILSGCELTMADLFAEVN